jgi:hypothetical protein
MDRVFSVSTVAGLIDRTPGAVRKLERRGKLLGFRVDARLFFKESEVMAFLSGVEAGQTQRPQPRDSYALSCEDQSGLASG